MKSTKESGFSAFGFIITIALLIILIGAGYFAYTLVKDKKANLTAEDAKNMITNQVDKAKDQINNAAGSAVEDATNSAVDSVKDKIDDSLNSLKK